MSSGVVQAMFIQGCYSSRYDYYYGGNYYRYNYYYPCPFPRADYKNNMKIPDEDMRCDVCIAPNGAEYRMRCWYDYGAWEWVWAGIGIFLLVVLVGLLIWCCMVEEKFPEENFRVNREMRDEILVYDSFLAKFRAKF